MPQLNMFSWFNQIITTTIVMFIFYMFLVLCFLPNTTFIMKSRTQLVNCRTVMFFIFMLIGGLLLLLVVNTIRVSFHKNFIIFFGFLFLYVLIFLTLLVNISGFNLFYFNLWYSVMTFQGTKGWFLRYLFFGNIFSFWFIFLLLVLFSQLKNVEFNNFRVLSMPFLFTYVRNSNKPASYKKRLLLKVFLVGFLFGILLCMLAMFLYLPEITINKDLVVVKNNMQPLANYKFLNWFGFFNSSATISNFPAIEPLVFNYKLLTSPVDNDFFVKDLSVTSEVPQSLSYKVVNIPSVLPELVSSTVESLVTKAERVEVLMKHYAVKHRYIEDTVAFNDLRQKVMNPNTVYVSEEDRIMYHKIFKNITLAQYLDYCNVNHHVPDPTDIPPKWSDDELLAFEAKYRPKTWVPSEKVL